MIEYSDRRKRTILVSGATGRQGSAVVNHLLKEGWRVKALTRNATQPKACDLVQKGAEIVHGDMNDLVSLEKAMKGVYGVFSVQVSWGQDAGVEVVQGKNMALVAGKMGVQHFIYSSAGGSQRATGVRPQQQKRQVELYISDINLPATVLQPASFMENYLMENMISNLKRGMLAEPLSTNTLIQRIAVEDIAVYVGLLLSRPEEFIGTSMEIAGDIRTMSDTAQAFANILKRPIEYIQMSWDEFRNHSREEMVPMFKWIEKEGFDANIEHCRNLHSDLLTLEEWIVKNSENFLV